MHHKALEMMFEQRLHFLGLPPLERCENAFMLPYRL